MNKRTVKIGAGRKRIEIPSSLYPFDGFTGQREDLHARTILVAGRDRTAVFISLELTSLMEDVVDHIRDSLVRDFGLERECISVSASHTFQAPHIKPEEAPMDGAERDRNRRFRIAVLEAAESSFQEARDNLRPGRIGFGTGSCDANINRDEETAEGWWKGSDPRGPSDKTLFLIRWEDLSGEPIGFLINYAVQSAVLNESIMSSGDVLASPDLGGFVSRYLEKTYGDKPVAIWTTGAAGDQDPLFIANRHVIDRKGRYSRRDIHEAGFLLVELLGERLGREAVRVSESMGEFSDRGDILALEKPLTLPGQKIFPNVHDMKPSREYQFEPADDLELTIGLILLEGRIPLIGIAPEIVCATALEIRKGSPFDDTVIMTMVNGAAKYLPDASAYDRITYAAMNSRGARGAAEILITEITDLLHYAYSKQSDRKGDTHDN